MSRALAGLSFALSGFVNPERAHLRQAGLDLGAKYHPDWTPSTTHLICALAGTPKAIQVRCCKFCCPSRHCSMQVQQAKADTHVVSKEWLSSCSASGRREDETNFSLASGKSAAKPVNQVARTSPPSSSKTLAGNAPPAAVGLSVNSERAAVKDSASAVIASSPPPPKRQKQTNIELGRSEV
jgi:DNA-repair protein XRCC1